MIVVVVLVIGWITAIPAAIWWERDTRHISGRTWYWSGYQRHVWTRGIVVGLVMSGWPAIVIVLAWRVSEQRSELTAECTEQRQRHDRSVDERSDDPHRRDQGRA